jgi:hypothetical protein
MLIIDDVISQFTNTDYAKLKSICSFHGYSNSDLVNWKRQVIHKHMPEEIAIIRKYLYYRKKRYYDMQLEGNDKKVQKIIDAYWVTHIDLMYPSNLKLKGMKKKKITTIKSYFLWYLTKNKSCQ